jgi:hypothetical protein
MTVFGKGWIWGKEDANINVEKTVKQEESKTLDINSILGDFKIPDVLGSSGYYNDYTSNYEDNSIININIEKNEYVSADEIVDVVNKKLKTIRQARS